jgi:hypothetical protein
MGARTIADLSPSFHCLGPSTIHPRLVPVWFPYIPETEEHKGHHFLWGSEVRTALKMFRQQDAQFCDGLETPERWWKFVDCRGVYVKK